MTTVMVKETQQMKRKVLANFLIHSVARRQIFVNMHSYNFIICTIMLLLYIDKPLMSSCTNFFLHKLYYLTVHFCIIMISVANNMCQIRALNTLQNCTHNFANVHIHNVQQIMYMY